MTIIFDFDAQGEQLLLCRRETQTDYKYQYWLGPFVRCATLMFRDCQPVEIAKCTMVWVLFGCRRGCSLGRHLLRKDGMAMTWNPMW